jgi:septation ring formation regulator EzrA
MSPESMGETIHLATVDDRLAALERSVAEIRDLIREDIEDLNAEIENRIRRIYDTMEHGDECQSNDLARLKRSLETDLDRIRYDVSTLEGRCGALERGGRW